MNEKRIPIGTTVRWKTRYESDPLHVGVVVGYDSTFEGHPAIYIVKVPANRPSRRHMTPLAANLEAQNPTKLKRVK